MVLGGNNGPDESKQMQVFLRVGQNSEPRTDVMLVLNGVALPVTAQVHSWGALLDSSLLLENKIAAVARGKEPLYPMRNC